MLRKIFILFRIGRRLAMSDAVDIISKIHQPPLIIKLFIKVFSFSFSKEKDLSDIKSDEDKLCESIQGMGTTFIKLGQFLATRPDIIGEEISKKLEKLQDRLPPFTMQEAKNILKESLGLENFNSILNLSEPVAAASIAQVHKAQINENGTIKNVAIKILRPQIRKVFNDEMAIGVNNYKSTDNSILKVKYKTDLKDNAKSYLEGHLKSPDFFHVESYPTASITFESDNKIIGETLRPGRYFAIWSYTVNHSYINIDSREYPLIPVVDYYTKPVYIDISYNEFLFNNVEPIFKVPDNLDLIFIDGSHTFESARNDYLHWKPKLRPGGVLAIHDVYDSEEEGGQAPREIYLKALTDGFKLKERINSLVLLN